MNDFRTFDTFLKHFDYGLEAPDAFVQSPASSMDFQNSPQLFDMDFEELNNRVLDDTWQTMRNEAPTFTDLDNQQSNVLAQGSQANQSEIFQFKRDQNQEFNGFNAFLPVESNQMITNGQQTQEFNGQYQNFLPHGSQTVQYYQGFNTYENPKIEGNTNQVANHAFKNEVLSIQNDGQQAQMIASYDTEPESVQSVYNSRALEDHDYAKPMQNEEAQRSQIIIPIKTLKNDAMGPIGAKISVMYDQKVQGVKAQKVQSTSNRAQSNQHLYQVQDGQTILNGAQSTSNMYQAQDTQITSNDTRKYSNEYQTQGNFVMYQNGAQNTSTIYKNGAQATQNVYPTPWINNTYKPIIRFNTQQITDYNNFTTQIQPQEQKTLVTKAPKKKVPTKMTKLHLNSEKIEARPYIFSLKNQEFEVPYGEILHQLRVGNFLQLIVTILRETVQDLEGYTLTGQRQIFVRNEPGQMNSYKKIIGGAKKLPDELNEQIREFVLKNEILKFEPETLEQFDLYIKSVFTRAFNRGQNLEKKRNDNRKKVLTKK